MYKSKKQRNNVKKTWLLQLSPFLERGNEKIDLFLERGITLNAKSFENGVLF